MRATDKTHRPIYMTAAMVSIDDFSTWRAVRFADPDEIG